MKEQELRLHRCCFTGHRPEKLTVPEKDVIAGLNREIITAIDDGFITFISGMARGVDICAGEIVIALKKDNQDLHLMCAVPYPNFYKSWSKEWRDRYRAVLASSDYTVYMADRYNNPGIFMIRNKWLVDHSSRVIAVYNGVAGRRDSEYNSLC